jgi:hypothetical protein
MPSDSPERTKIPSALSIVSAAFRSAASATSPWNVDTASFCPPPNIFALRSGAFLDCPSHARHTLIRTLGILQGPTLGFVPDDRLVQAMYQPALRVRILILLYSRLYGTEFATMPGGAPEVAGGGLDGRTSDSASDSDRKRFKTDSGSSREQYSVQLHQPWM